MTSLQADESVRTFGPDVLSTPARPAHYAVGRQQSTEADPNRDSVWSEALPQLLRFVLSLGVSAEDAQDVVQETATRAITRQVPHADAQDLLRWCQVTARRLVIDLHRRSSRLTAFPDEPVPAAVDVHNDVQARIALQRVFAATKDLLTPAEQEAISALLVDQEPPADRRGQVRSAVARNRARNRLRSIVGYPWAVAVAAALARGLRRAPRTNPAPALAATAAVVTVVFSAGSHPALHLQIRSVPPGASVAHLRDAPRLAASVIPDSKRAAARRTASTDATGSGSTRPPTTTVVRAHGPGQSQVEVTREPAPRDAQLLCTGGVGDLPLDEAICIG